MLCLELRARVSTWPPLRLARLRCERESVCVVSARRFLSRHAKRRGTGVRSIGMDVHRSFAQVAVVEDGVCRDEGRIGVKPEELRAWADTLEPDDEVVLEATTNSDAIATMLRPLVRPGGGVEPAEDPGHRRGEGQDRQGRRPHPGPAARRGLPGGDVGGGRPDPDAAPPRRPPDAPGPPADPAEEPGPRDPGPEPGADLPAQRPVRPGRAALAGRARRCPPTSSAASTRCCASWTSTATNSPSSNGTSPSKRSTTPSWPG